MDTGEQPANPLAARRDALIDEIFRSIPLQSPFYRRLSEETLKGVAERLVNLYLSSLVEDRTEAIRTWGVDAFVRRQQQGASLTDALRALGATRKVFSRAARSLEPEALAEDTGERIESVSANLVDAAVAAYERSAADAASAFAQLEARYREIYHRTPAMMHSLDPNRKITAVSERWLDTLGYAVEEVLDRRSVDFFTEESRRRALALDLSVAHTDSELFDVPYQLVKKSGEIIDVRTSSVLVRDSHGELTQILTVFDDVTAELAATRALRESEERWRALIELSPLPLCVHRAGILLWLNDATARLLGAASPEEIVGRNVMDFVHPDDHAMVIARVRESQLHNESLPPLEERYVRLDGSIIYVEVAARSVMFEGQRATQTATVDITARRQAEEARRLSEAQARIIEAQVETLRALSTPLIPIDEGILVLPLIGRVTADRAEHILEVLAAGVVAQRASVAILDVTGVPEGSSELAEALVLVAKAVRLLGAEVVITGVSPSIARALVGLGADLGRLTTCGTLRDGIAHARSRRRR